MLNIYQTHTMLRAVEQTVPAPSFLRDRYLVTGADDMFPTDEVLIEYSDFTGHKMAPVVLPRKGSIDVARDGYRTDKMAPPLVAPSRPLSIDDLNKKGFGENLFSDRTPAKRQAEILMRDLADFDKMITTREEYITAQLIFNNGYILKQYADKYGEGEYKEFEVRFYDGDVNPAQYVPGIMWNGASSDKYSDLFHMILMLTSKGNKATEVLLGADAAEELMKDATIQKLMDLARYNVGNIDPVALPHDAARLGTLNIRGRRIDLLTYDGTYNDEETGEVKPFVPAKKIAVTTPGAGRLLYGAVTQMEQTDGQFHSYPGRRVPQYWADKQGRSLTVSSRPLAIPNVKDCFVSATVLD